MGKPGVVALRGIAGLTMKPIESAQESAISPRPGFIAETFGKDRLGDRAPQRFVDVVFLGRWPMVSSPVDGRKSGSPNSSSYRCRPVSSPVSNDFDSFSACRIDILTLFGHGTRRLGTDWFECLGGFWCNS
jgi:hypothetical protein